MNLKWEVLMDWKKLIFIVYSTICIVSAQALDSNSTVVDPGLSAQLSVGFNYDFLRSPLNVSFDKQVGYFSVNIPVKFSIPNSINSLVPDQIEKTFPEGKKFTPETYARQYGNTTLRVDLPNLLLKNSVLTVSNIQMMYLNYNNVLKIPRLEVGTSGQGGDGKLNLFLRGIVSIPIDFSLGWETLTLGYAYKLNDMFTFAVNLHRHSFHFDLQGKVDIDILGRFSTLIKQEGIEYPIKGDLDYSLKNSVEGHYDLVRYSPSFAIRAWRFELISRFGMKAEAKGYLDAVYSVPFFMDPESFAIETFTEEYVTENFDRFRNSESNQVVYSTQKKMKWQMPHAHTLSFDILPKKLSLSYTKLFNQIEMELYDDQVDLSLLEDSTDTRDVLDFRVSAKVDHVLLLHGDFPRFNFNLGIFALDFGFRDKENILANKLTKFRFGKAGMVTPVLNMGTVVGRRVQGMLELDLLPLVAIKTGIVYYF